MEVIMKVNQEKREEEREKEKSLADSYGKGI